MKEAIEWKKEWGTGNESIQDLINNLTTEEIGDYLLYLILTWIEGNKKRNVSVNNKDAQIKLIIALRELKYLEYDQFAGKGNFLAGLGVLAMNDLLVLVGKKWGINREDLDIYNPIAKANKEKKENTGEIKIE